MGLSLATVLASGAIGHFHILLAAPVANPTGRSVRSVKKTIHCRRPGRGLLLLAFVSQDRAAQ
jgi:hypothetical protein